ncbi:uncharacterized protein CXorf65 homolog [Antedon mediterranea]|uniref:uncharacterized protein CXorf65 homolog n=1 Tax=Antedon mediterranea TaxID=105859 RepID=UPI003AF80478
MFITVRYGEREEALFNPNCKTMLLLENIRHRCRLSEDVEVDLADPEGNVKHLIEASLRYANEVLKERETFVLIKVEKDDESRKPSYIPLLNDQEQIDAAFLARLSTREQSSSGSAKGSRKRRDANKSNTSKRPPKSTTPTGKKGSKR